jgi:hypothetical protein
MISPACHLPSTSLDEFAADPSDARYEAAVDRLPLSRAVNAGPHARRNARYSDTKVPFLRRSN